MYAISISAKKSRKNWSDRSDCNIQGQLEELKKIASSKKCKVADVPGDGNCAIHAIIGQLKEYSPNVVDDVQCVQTVRKKAVEYMRSNPENMGQSFLLDHQYNS